MVRPFDYVHTGQTVKEHPHPWGTDVARTITGDTRHPTYGILIPYVNNIPQADHTNFLQTASIVSTHHLPFLTPLKSHCTSHKHRLPRQGQHADFLTPLKGHRTSTSITGHTKVIRFHTEELFGTTRQNYSSSDVETQRVDGSYFS